MKPTDLMIGDWVMVKVLSQIPNTYVLHAWTANDYSRDLQVKPIEITYDLLKANGWKGLIDKYAVTCELGCFYESNSVLLEWDKSRKILTIWCDWINGNGRKSADIIIPVKYIHQIQQVLRLAGMTELANNFKI